jgi:DNA-directed RNA polymerase subunit RPC12/RpoP
VKFACDRCGKRYASVDEPAPGRVYRIRCKCGHVIVVRGTGASRGAAEARLRRVEAQQLPPPLEAPRAAAAPPAESHRLDTLLPPPRQDPPVRGSGEAARPREEGPEVVAAPGLAAPGEAPSVSWTLRHASGDETEPAIADDPFRRGGGGPEPEARGSAGLVVGERAVAPPLETPFVPAPGAVAATDARPVLSLGLDDGASGARRWILPAAVFVMLAIGAALAVWRP